MVTDIQLKQICSRLNDQRAIEVADTINKVCPMYGINTSDILHEFLANVIHESAEFTRYEENLRYSARRLMQVWPSRFKTLDVAKQYEYNAPKLAEFVYGGRRDLGNVKEGDGFTFRGSGAIQTTGRRNTELFAAYMKSKFGIDKTPEQMAILMRTTDEYAIHSACYFFAVSKKLIQAAIDDNIELIAKRINGGFIGMKDRTKYYKLCIKYIP